MKKCNRLQLITITQSQVGDHENKKNKKFPLKSENE